MLTKRMFQLIVALFVAGYATTGSAQSQVWEGSSILDDPSWRKSFLGSYGFLSGAEPEVASAELEMLRDVLNLMKVNPRAAATMLQEQSGPDSSAALDFILANLQFQNGDLDGAMASYERSLEKFPDFRRAHKNLGLLFVQRSDCEQGLRHMIRAVELGDRDGRSYGLMGFCQMSLGNALAAEGAYLNAVMHQPDVRDWKLGMARALLALDKHQEAVSLFGSLIDEDPADAKAWLLQANAYIGLDQPMDAAMNLETVRLLGEAQPSSLVLLGDIYMNAKMYDLAKSAYLEVIAGDDSGMQFASAYRAADLLLRTHSHDAAGEILSSIDRRYGEDLHQEDELKVLTLKAKLARAEGRDNEAAALLESIVERDGTRGDALLELAAHLQGRGEEAKALMLVERAERLDGFEYQALLDHAQYMVAARDYEKAAELLRRALEIKRELRVEHFLARVEEAIRA